ncbi:MAG: DUF448 domain-containing protein [Alphaproteobacteria bacterium]|nr:DUF448 domain-containing protein [Alphaproteobacteria bacterium]
MSEELEITRKCVVSGEIKSKEELLRFVLLRNGTVVPDFDKKLEGKGFYVSNSKNIIAQIGNTIRIGKLLHTNAKALPDLVETVEKILAKKGLDSLNLARKTGSLVFGFEKVKEALLKKKVAFIVKATDAGSDGDEKISALAKETNCYSLYNSATMSEALNRENTVYIAVEKSKISAMTEKNLQKYKTFLNE